MIRANSTNATSCWWRRFVAMERGSHLRNCLGRGCRQDEAGSIPAPRPGEVFDGRPRAHEARSRAIPILGAGNEISEWFGSADDVTVQHRAQNALRESEERLRVLVEGVPQQVWRAEPGGLWTWSSPQWHRYTGLSEAESRGNGWLAAVHPDDRNALTTAWYEAANSHVFEVECRIRHVERMDYRWFRGRATPLLDPQGHVVEWLGTFTDVNDMRVLQGRQEVLLAELQHRVRNIMAVIRTVAARTAENSATVLDFAARLGGRLEAFARTQVILTRHAGVGVDLEGMVRDELLAQTTQSEQVDMEGPRVSLSAKAAEVLTLAVHELATNAVKHGALSRPDDSVRIHWGLDNESGETLLTLRWTETGTAVSATKPLRKGFGTELIEQRVPYELNGTGRLDLLPEGVAAVISFPLRPGDSILQTDAGTARSPNGSLA
ncbi:MAG: PAS domain S-box protein [Oxalobacteraceae bacterium]|nr:MAG: PAS domain S-box protein [Oxalobacteraceae bacterium]